VLLMVLRDSMMQGNWVDDRPPKATAGWLAHMNELASKIIEKYPESKDAYTEVDEAQKDMFRNMKVGEVSEPNGGTNDPNYKPTYIAGDNDEQKIIE